MENIYKQTELDQMKCSNPDCDHSAHDSEMYFWPSCHPDSPTISNYYKGILTIRCIECDQIVLQVEVAK